MNAACRLLTLPTCLVLSLVLLAGTSLGQGKQDKPEVVGVIVQVHRDKDAKDNDLGFIVVDQNKKDRKIIVTKRTEVNRGGKEVGFKALDKGDLVAVYTLDKHPNVADKIVIRKND